MGWGRRWPEREARPKVRRLTEEKKEEILRTLEKGIAASPVLSAFAIKALARRGRFYMERPCLDEDGESYGEVWGRIKPSESQSIADAEAWLVKRKWRAW